MADRAPAVRADAARARRARFGGRKLVAVVKREFTERVRTRWFVISTLLGPVFFAALTILPAWLAIRERGSGNTANIVVVDASGAGLGERIARALADSAGRGPAPGAPARGAPAVVVVAPGSPALVAQAESAATAAVVRKERLGYLVVDNATLAGRRARYAGRNASSIADVERVRDVVARAVLAARLEREGLPAERVLALTGTRLRVSTDRITDEGRSAGSGVGGALVATVTAFLLYVMILLYGQNVLRSVLEEKTTRVAEVIVASVRPDVLMAGKVLGVGAVGLLQQLLWFAGAAFIGTQVAPLLARAARGGAAAAPAGPDAAGAFGALPSIGAGVLVAYLAFFLLGYLLYSALFAAVGAMVGSEQEAQQAAFPVMMPLIASAVLIQLVLRNPESAAAKFGAWFPLTAPVIMPMRMSLVDVGPGETAAVIAGLTLTVLLAVWLAARIYRVGLLMYGKRPGIGELARWVRQAG
jgi:ABC-2 type transport system permease protein